MAKDKFIIETVESSGHITIHDEPREAQTQILERFHPGPDALLLLERTKPREHVKQIKGLQSSNRRVIELLERLIARGEAEGSFRKGIDPVDLHLNMTALAFYNVSNQFTFAHNFGIDMTSPDAIARRASQVADIIIAWVTHKD